MYTCICASADGVAVVGIKNEICKLTSDFDLEKDMNLSHLSQQYLKC